MAHEHIAIAPQLADNASAQSQLVSMPSNPSQAESDMQSTFMPVEQKPNLPPNMRQWTRWEYLSEFVGFWKYGIITKAMGLILVVIGALMLSTFPIGGFLCLIVAGRLLDLAWWYNFIVFQYGKNRTIVLVD